MENDAFLENLAFRDHWQLSLLGFLKTHTIDVTGLIYGIDARSYNIQMNIFYWRNRNVLKDLG